MRLPVALLAWAQQHKDRVSQATFNEACRIAEEIDKSTMRNVAANDPEAARKIAALFYTNRSERATALISVTQKWLKENSLETQARGIGVPSTPQIVRTDSKNVDDLSEDRDLTIDPTDSHSVDALDDDSGLSGGFQTSSSPADGLDSESSAVSETTHDGAAGVASAAGDTGGSEAGAGGGELDSLETALPEPEPKALDEAGLLSHVAPEEGADDPATLYGPKRRVGTFIGVGIAALILLGLVAVVWKFGFGADTPAASDSETPAETGTKEVEPTATPIPTATPESEPEATVTPEVEPTTAPVEPEPVTPPEPTLLADTTPILNSGSATIATSTYRVSPANRVVLTGHRSGISSLSVTEDGRVITGGLDSHVVDWGDDVPVSSPVRNTATAEITALALSGDEQVIVGLRSGALQILDTTGEGATQVFDLLEAGITSVIQLDSSVIVAASADGQIALFNPGTNSDTETADSAGGADTAGVNEAIVAAAGQDPVGLEKYKDGFVMAGGDGIVRYFADYDLAAATFATPIEIDVGSPITALSAVGDSGNSGSRGQTLVGLLDGSLATVDIEKAEVINRGAKLHNSAVRTVSILEVDGVDTVVTGGDDGTIVIWNEDLSEAQRTLYGHGDSVTAVEQLKDLRLVSSSLDATGRVWDLEQRLGQPTISTHAANISAIAPAGPGTVITGDSDGRVVIESLDGTVDPIDVTHFESPVIGVTRLNTGAVAAADAEGSVVISADTQADADGIVRITLDQPTTAIAAHGDQEAKLITGHSDGVVRVLDAETELLSTQAHEGAISALAGLGDGRVVSAGQDKKMRILDFENKPKTVALHPNVVNVITVMSDGRVLSGSVDGIYLWEPDNPLDSAIRFAGHHQKLLSLVEIDADTFLSSDIDGRVRRWTISEPEAEPEELLDIPGVINPNLALSNEGAIVVAAARGFVVLE